MSTSANCAKAIREELKGAFPAVKFSVTSESFSMGNAVRIGWIDSPITKEVESITDKYQYGHLNGMEDMYENTNSRDDIPQAKYVTTNRKMSDEVRAILEPQAEEITKNWEGYNENINFLYRLFCKNSIPVGATVTGIGHTQQTCGSIEDLYTIEITTPETSEPQIEKVEVESGKVQVIEYSEKAIAMIGDTKPIKDKLKGLGGKFNFRLSCGPGWIFPKSKIEEIKKALTVKHEGLNEEVQKMQEFLEETKVKTISDEKLIEMYLDYVNNYVTVEAFASANDLTTPQANEVIEQGKRLNEIKARVDKVYMEVMKENEVKEYDNLKNIEAAAESGEMISILNLYNLVNKKSA